MHNSSEGLKRLIVVAPWERNLTLGPTFVSTRITTASTDNTDSLRVSLAADHAVPSSSIPANPYPPSPSEAQYFYYGLPSQPVLIARSSTYPWLKPTGLEAYLAPKEISPFGLHPLGEIWESTVGPAIVSYLDSKEVQWTSLDPVRIGYSGDVASVYPIIWVGVVPGSLSAEVGVEIARHCKSILNENNIHDVHVEIRNSEVTRSAGPKMFKPVPTSNPTAKVREPFSTTLGLPICAEGATFEGTGGFYISDPRFPGKLYLVTARHVVLHPDEDKESFVCYNPSQPRKNVLLFGEVEKHIKAIKSEIDGIQVIITQLENRLEDAEDMGEEAEAEREEVKPLIEKKKKAIESLETFYNDVSKNWQDPKNQDWALIEASKIDSTNFVGNAIDLGTTIAVEELTAWMYPSSFKYPGNRLLKLKGTISDEEMWKPSPRTFDHNNDPCITVIKRGHGSGLTVGRLNTIRSFTRLSKGQESKEIAVLPRNSNSGLFSKPGDSGSVVVDGKGRIAGLLTSSAGVSDVSDCTYVTSINFIMKRMRERDLKANLSPIITT
ncbi:hypothetical protein VKT23_013904 [Stygiomarasmius scandens]|uniref:Serine protease n=1 Tax=Marasmiellus scandens TaxID=2682957 RepID=A0ABR1J4Y9_9AGAR